MVTVVHLHNSDKNDSFKASLPKLFSQEYNTDYIDKNEMTKSRIWSCTSYVMITY